MSHRIIRFFAVILSVLGLFIATSALLTGTMGVRSSLLSVISLITPVVLIINVFIFVFWLVAKSRWTLVPVLTLLAGLPYIGTVMYVTSVSSTKDEPMLTLCTYNTQGFSYGESGLTMQLFAEFVKQHNVTILCLQEMDETKQALADSLFEHQGGLYTHSTLSGSQPGYALSVYSIYPLIHSADIPFPGTDNHAMRIDALIGSDTVRIVNLHLQTTHFNQKKFKLSRERWVWETQDETRKTFSLVEELMTNSALRNAQADTIAALINDSPFPIIVCGDWNSIPASYPYWKFKQLLKDGFRTAGNGYEYTYRYFGNLLRIDYIFHHPDLKGLSYKSYNLDYSDHKPVIMNLSMNKQSRKE